MDDRRSLGAFLRSRRDRADPGSAGIKTSPRRRVPGLRREELAHLAGISAEYYQRLEQGRAHHPSDQILDAIAAVLVLDPTERDHLYRLARPPRPHRSQPGPTGPVRTELRRLLAAVCEPALVINDRFDVLALNEPAQLLFSRPAGTTWNMARELLLDPASRRFYLDWDETVAATATQLRAVAASYPDDAELTLLIDELTAGSDAFRAAWATGDVQVRAHGTKQLRHPDLGARTFAYENFNAAGDPRQRLVTLTLT
ncbi:MAG: helix-turn-helix domain-containing protein [Catenulispora sp.]|nr:helix-turn-helix domain-containing protein [Catenulispora sp.]